MIPKSGYRFPAFAKPASAGEARSEKIMLKQRDRVPKRFNEKRKRSSRRQASALWINRSPPCAQNRRRRTKTPQAYRQVFVHGAVESPQTGELLSIQLQGASSSTATRAPPVFPSPQATVTATARMRGLTSLLIPAICGGGEVAEWSKALPC